MLIIFFIALFIASLQPKPVEASIHVNEKTKMVSDIPVNLAPVKFEVMEIKKAVKVLGGSIDVESLFDKYSGEYSVDKNLLKKIANCESHFNPGSRNGDYGGMFQFASQTWINTRNQMGLDSNPDLRFSGEEAIRTAAFKISRGGVSAWANCAR